MKGHYSNQQGFSDHLLQSKVSDTDFLVRMDAKINWQVFEPLLSSLYSTTGRPGYPPLLLFKMTLLQQWFGLSDPGVEAATKDRLSFHRFLGLSLDDQVPDETTLVRFRQRLRHSKGTHKALFSLLDQQLESEAVVIKAGTLIDASIIQSSRKPPKRRGKDSSDREARWTTKNQQSTHGYKVHIGSDHGSDIVRSVKVTPANVHDSKVCDELICGDEQAVFADKAYHSEARSHRLRAAGQLNGILRRAKRNHPLSELEQQFNRLASKFRSPVERIFADWKQHRNLRRMRYYGLEKNQHHLYLMALAHNMRCLLRAAG